ncbi:glycoside hydrolase/deacetylase [Neocallimastix lanati (nom. inval.)]|jgi:peptidoglycan/xylan/chitin deacetylase (PgdA/CDA1 family)|uniref:Glycoside hydrolase/deacetylase n=1 Tax=Neocallimastix californiae TaxID=1754190 RepID=A0A1Y2F5T4_9FUNG|nr:glycoside hydrolase/deacetylase [Neocallimastix sp. JGI-2020a]ORY79241.1 glycoside hydrolase/deacetylase [Neocallimastix californiae]|eukprot:ORY79241.1 glycoside hydrolase/deacetylase [Neocallimastix californiae]
MKFYYCLVLAITFLNLVKSEIDFIRSCTEPKTIALTFDDGPWKYTNELIDYMINQKDVKITFFQLGRFHYPFAFETEEYQQAMKRAHDYGFQIASHTYGHKISNVTEEFDESLTMMDDLIERVTGDRPHYFRAPKGECNDDCKALLEQRGYRLIQWDTDTNDWNVEASGSIERRVEDSINFLKEQFAEERDSYLILMHDTHNYTVEQIAPWIVEQSGMREKGYRFVTVAECLGEKEYMYVSGKNYGEDAINNNNNNNVSSIPNVQQNLESSAFIKFKPLSLLLYLNIGLIFTLLFI